MAKCGRPKGVKNKPKGLIASPEADSTPGTPKRYKARWTAEEDAYLQDKWGQVSAGAIAKTLDRSENAIYRRASELHLGGVVASSGSVSFRCLLLSLGYAMTDPKTAPWVRAGLPVRYKRVRSGRIAVVRLDEFWAWAKDHKHMIDLSRMEPLTLGDEPDWVPAKRRADTANQRTLHRCAWTDEEVSWLKAMVGRLTLSEMAAELGRSECAVRTKLNKLRLGWKLDPSRTLVRWKAEEFETLDAGLLDGKTFEEIARELTRTESSVRSACATRYGTNSRAKAVDLIRQKTSKPKRASYVIRNEHNGRRAGQAPAEHD